jgi:GT2 family glycosyltransferase
MAKDLTISIVNYNSKRSILNCLESIHANSNGLDTEVYVVDNNSTDGSVEATKKLYPKIKLILNKDNRGFAKANNQVLRIADSRYCLITNPDVIFLPGALKAMVNFMDSHQGAGAVGCKVLNIDRSLQYSCRRYPTFLMILLRGIGIELIRPNCRLIERYLMKDIKHEGVLPVDWLTGCCLMVRKETIDEVGLLDEKFFMYFEDADLCYRINERWQVYYLSDVCIVHEFQHMSRRFGNLKHKIHHLRSAAHFFRRHGLVPTRISQVNSNK